MRATRARASDSLDAPSPATTALPTTRRSGRRALDPDDHPELSDRPDPSATAVLPAAPGGRRRRIDPGDPDLPAATTALPTAYRSARRAPDPSDAPEPVDRYPSDRHAIDAPAPHPLADPSDHPATTARPTTSRAGRRALDPTDAPEPVNGHPSDRRGRPPAGPATAPPGERRRRSGPADPEESPGDNADGLAFLATIALPVTRPSDRRAVDPADAPPEAAPRPPVDPPAGNAATALLAAPGERRRRAEPADAGPPVEATGGRRHRTDAGGPHAPSEAPDRRDRPEAPGPGATTVLPATGGARRRPEPEGPPGQMATTALPAAAPTSRDPEATSVVPAPARKSERPDAAAGEAGATTHVPAVSPTSDPPGTSRRRRRIEREDDTSMRASRIDETLTRLTAAHAGLTLAVTDRRDDDEEPPAPPVKRSIGVTAGRILAGALAVMVFATAAFGWGARTWLGSAVRDAAALDPESTAVVDAAAQSGDENVLVVATEPNSDNATPRADTVAVVHIPDTGDPVTVLAFPTDLEINRPPCQRWDPATATYQDEPVRAESRTQLISALDLGGPACVTQVVQQLTGLAISQYIGTDLSALPAMTDAVGGAEVCVPRPVLDRVLGPVVPEAGTNELGGVRVADFVQAGDVESDPSAEYGRIERQQQVIAAVLDEAMSGTALLDLGRLTTLRPALGDAMVADGAAIDDVHELATTLQRLDAEGVQFAAVPTGERNSQGNTVLRDTDAAALFAALRTDAPLPAEATDPGGRESGPTPGELTVTVFNASDRSGLAGEVGETLQSLGFGLGEIANAEQPTSETVIRFSPDQASAAALLAATVPSADSVPDPGTTGVLELVLGRSFDDVVRAPSEPIALSAPTPEPTEPPVTCT